MNQTETILSPPQIKIVADPRRLLILTKLMKRPMTISQLGREVNKQPSWVRHHVKVLESAGVIRVNRIQISDGYVEKYYQANAKAYLIRQLIIPEQPGQAPVIGSGSHDPALDQIIRDIQDLRKPEGIFYLRNGSLDGLIAVRQGIAQFAGCHLYDPKSSEYNLSFIRHIFPDRPVKLVTLAQRTQGLIFSSNNPKGIRDPADVMREDIRIVNRNRGSGTRIRFDQQLQLMGILPANVRGYSVEAGDHEELAAAISTGRADIGLGLQAAAAKAGLGFLPLFSERFDLMFPNDQFEISSVQQLLDLILSMKSKKILESTPGYDVKRFGDINEL